MIDKTNKAVSISKLFQSFYFNRSTHVQASITGIKESGRVARSVTAITSKIRNKRSI